MNEIIPKIYMACKEHKRRYLKADKRKMYNLAARRRLFNVVKKFLSKYEEYQNEYKNY